jgi:putative transposase
VSVAAFIATQRTDHGVPHATTCRTLGVSESWFYKWHRRGPSARQRRRDEIDAKVAASFAASEGSYGSPRVLVDLREAGVRVSKKTVEASMARQGLVARPAPRRRRSLTRQDPGAPVFPDLVQRDFSAPAPNIKWCGDLTEVPTDEGKLYLAATEDLFSRRVLGFAMSDHPDAELARASLLMAVANRGGSVAGVIFHTDRGSTYTASDFAAACTDLAITQSMGRIGSALDNAAAESFFSTLDFECLSKHHFATKEQARRTIARWVDDWYNRQRRHSTCGMIPPVAFELARAAVQAA